MGGAKAPSFLFTKERFSTVKKISKAYPLLLALALAILGLAPREAGAYWVSDGAAICAAAEDQDWPKSVSDGAGGVIVTWIDGRSGGGYDIYAQRVDGRGETLWAADGIVVCDYAGDQLWPVIAGDGAGGAIIAWQDYRGSDVGIFAQSAEADIYAQRIDGDGDLLWAADGVPLCTAAEPQLISTIAPDGAGGAFVTWMDFRGGADFDVYAQRLSAGGIALWAAGGVPMCAADGNQEHPTVVASGIGSAIVTWDDERDGGDDVYAQFVDAAGTVRWTADGMEICVETGDQEDPTIATDGAGGAIITWDDRRTSLTDIYAQRVTQSGTVKWTGGGVALCSAPGNQYLPQIVSDDDGGAIVTWWDARSDTGDIYVARVDSLGASLWDPDGVALCAESGAQRSPSITSDGHGGAIVAWSDRRTPSSNIYARRVDAAGNALWLDGGVAICTYWGYQGNPKIVTDGDCGAIVVWKDQRSGNFDVYAGRICDCGTADVPVAGPGRVGSLGQNAPNPFTFSTRISFRLHEAGHVTLRVFDASGRLVRVLLKDYRAPKSHTVVWDGTDRYGRAMPAGTYFYRLDTPGWSASKKLTLAR
jgi:hypothetical protein